MGKRRKTEADPPYTDTPTDTGRGNRPDTGRRSTGTPGAAATKEGLKHEIMFDALCSANYHSMRQQFFARAYRIATAVQALAATAAFAAITDTLPREWSAWLSLAVTTAAIFTLVWDPAGQARRHQELRRRFYDIHARAEAANDDATLRTVRHDMRIIYADEPPGYQAAKEMAYNAAVNSFYAPEEAAQHRIDLPWWRHAFANIMPFRSS